MKRFLVALCVLMLGTAVNCGAQLRYGAVTGLTFSELSGSKLRDVTLYHIGVTCQYDFPMGFAVQPSLLWQVRGINGDSRVGSLEIPVSLQWGPDLLAFRPYAEVVPFIGFNVWQKNMDMSGMSVGMGLGAGLDVWKMKLSCRYNWDWCRAIRGTREHLGYTTLTLGFLIDDSVWKRKK